MKQLTFEIKSNEQIAKNVYRMQLGGDTTGILPGQFVNIRVQGQFLRRPISVCNITEAKGTDGVLTIIYKVVGVGTEAMSQLPIGTQLDVLTVLGNGYDLSKAGDNPLLVGGGVGVAPLLDYGKYLKENGAAPCFLLGARSKSDLLEMEQFCALAPVFVTTEDGSEGEKGFVTQHTLLNHEKFDRISVCGPKPMMVSVAKYAKATSTPCEVSLENMMACGLGACLCCVEKTVKGNVCVCTEGPVFDVNELTWE